MTFIHVVEKTPNGKLSSSKEVINAVKVAIGARPLALSSKTAGPEDDLPPVAAPSSGGSTAAGIAGGVAMTVAGLATIKIIKSVSQFFGSLSKALKVVGLVNETQLNAQSEAKLVEIAKQLLNKAGPEAAKTVAKEVGAETIKAAGPAVEELVLETAGETAARTALTQSVKAPGVFSRIMGFLGDTAGGVAELGGTAVGEAGAGAITGAVGAGLAVGLASNIGMWKLFDHFYKSEDFAKAGQRVISEAEDVKDDWKPEQYESVNKLNTELQEAINLYPVLEQLKTNSTPQNIKDHLEKLHQLDISVNKLRGYAYDVESFAEDKKKDEWYNPLGGEKDVYLAAGNFVEVCSKTAEQIDALLRKVADFLNEQAKSQTAATGKSPALDAQYQNANNTIAIYEAKIKAKRLPNAQKMLAWLENMKTYVKEEQEELNTISPTIRQTVLPDYIKRMKDVQDRLTAFNKVIPQ